MQSAPASARHNSSTGPRASAESHEPHGGGRIDALDGLRAVSILFVLAGHGAWTRHAPAALQPVREMGIVGVELFFAISGFIITHLLLRERQRHGAIDLRRFWLRRALRILPPFAVMSAGIGIAAVAGIIPWSWPSFLGALTFTKNTLLLKGGWFFGHTWSLSLEEQFYLFWPLLLVTLATRRAELLLCALVMAAPALAQAAFVLLPAVQNILPYLPDLAAGCWLATMLSGRDHPFRRRFLQLPYRGALIGALTAAALVAAWFHDDKVLPHWSTPVEALLVPLTAMALIAELTLHDGMLRRLLSWSPLRALGLISYSLYLWQQLFMGRPEDYLQHWRWSAWPYNLIAALVSATLAYWLVERPCGRLKFYLRRRGSGAVGKPHAQSGLRQESTALARK